jgi:hypothetical protein
MYTADGLSATLKKTGFWWVYMVRKTRVCVSYAEQNLDLLDSIIEKPGFGEHILG